MTVLEAVLKLAASITTLGNAFNSYRADQSAHISMGPSATGQDQTQQLYNWLHAGQGRTCQWMPTLPDNPFRVAGLRWPTATRIIGSSCGPFTVGNPGTYLAPVKGYTGDLTYGEPLTSPNWWSHGTIIEGIGFFGDGSASVGLRWCGGEVSAIRDCAFTGFSQAGVKLIGGSAPFYAENISVYLNRYGVWINNAGGAIAFVNFGGDDNQSLMCIENSNSDPNGSGGRIVAITIENLKVETGTMLNGVGAAAASNNPIFRFIAANEASLAVYGGVVEDWSDTKGNRAIVHIEKSSASSRSAYVHIENLKNDNFKYVVVDDVLNVQKDVSAASSWGPAGSGAFMPIYHDHRIVRTSSP